VRAAAVQPISFVTLTRATNNASCKGYIPLHGPDWTRPDPHGPARTLSETRTDPTEFLGDPGRKKVRAGPVGSGRARVVEFSYNWVNLVQVSSVQLADFQCEHFHWKDVFIAGV